LHNSVEVVEEFKLLGVLLDCKLNFSNHILNLKKSITKKLFIIKNMFHYLLLSDYNFSNRLSYLILITVFLSSYISIISKLMSLKIFTIFAFLNFSTSNLNSLIFLINIIY
jgi:hypothetical protein